MQLHALLVDNPAKEVTKETATWDKLGGNMLPLSYVLIVHKGLVVEVVRWLAGIQNAVIWHWNLKFV